MKPSAKDRLDRAIEGGDHPSYVRVTMSTGRTVVLAMPRDVTEVEIFDIVQFLASPQVRSMGRRNGQSQEERQANAARLRILVPS